MTVPKSLDIAKMHYCSDLIKGGTAMAIKHDPLLSIAKGVEILLSERVGSRTVRKKIRDYCINNFTENTSNIVISSLDIIADIIININDLSIYLR